MTSPLRKFAQGQSCTVALFPYCQGWIDTETTVLAHLPSPGKGMGLKSPDWFGAHACAACHDIMDGRRRVPDISEQEIVQCEMNGLYKTLERLIAAGLITIKGGK